MGNPLQVLSFDGLGARHPNMFGLHQLMRKSCGAWSMLSKLQGEFLSFFAMADGVRNRLRNDMDLLTAVG